MQCASAGRNVTPVGVAALAILVVLPVVLFSIVLAGKFAQVLYFVFAVFVLLFSLGPRDLAEEVHDYCNAVENENAFSPGSTWNRGFFSIGSTCTAHARPCARV